MSSTTTMKAVHYEKPFQVSVREIPVPVIEHPDDVIVKVTTAGDDLWLRPAYVSRANGGGEWSRLWYDDSKPYSIQHAAIQPVLTQNLHAHANISHVQATKTWIGSGVTLLQKGDRIVLPFNVADGRCPNCEEGRTAFCTGVNPGFAGGAYGYVSMGPYQGGQAQYLRVPFADFNALKLPPGNEHEASFALLADIFPTGWHGLELSGFQPGESVAVFGAGPVGLMAAYSAHLRGAARIFVVDKVKERLEAVGKIP
ncbi:MAG: hypothetical protein Q9194_007055, partial [Teloschistes cf. exilis]